MIRDPSSVTTDLIDLVHFQIVAVHVVARQIHRWPAMRLRPRVKNIRPDLKIAESRADCLFELLRFDVIAIGENHRLVFLVVAAVAVEVANFQVIAHFGSIGSKPEFCCDSSDSSASIAIPSSIFSPFQSGIGVSGPISRPALLFSCRIAKTFPRKRFCVPRIPHPSPIRWP